MLTQGKAAAQARLYAMLVISLMAVNVAAIY